MVSLHKLAIIGSSIGMAILTTPLELALLPEHLYPILIGWKVYMFGVVPLIFLYIERKEK